MNKRIQFLLLPLLAIAASLLPSCSHEEDYPLGFRFTEMATLAETDPEVGSVMEIYPSGAMQPVRIPTNLVFTPEMWAVGERALVTYSNGTAEQYAPLPVQLYGFTPAVTVKRTASTPVSDIESAFAESSPFQVQAAWLTGPWLNIRALVPYLPGKLTISFATPTDTPAGTNIDIYSIFNVVTDDPASLTQIYFSVYIGEILAGNPQTATVTFHSKFPSDPRVETIKMHLPSEQ